MKYFLLKTYGFNNNLSGVIAMEIVLGNKKRITLKKNFLS